MVYHMPSLPRSSRKAQFFILSAFAIISILYFLSKWLQPTTIPDTSSIAAMDEPLIFNNIREKTFAVVNGSKNCEEIQFNLDEFKQTIDNFVTEKNYIIELDYAIPACTPPLVIDFEMRLVSTRMTLTSKFSVRWG